MVLAIFQYYFGKRGAKVIGVDASINAIRAAIWYAKKENVEDKCKFINSSTLSIKDNQKFDLIFLKDIIEHIPNDIEFLNQIVNHYLSSQGTLVITTPNTWSIAYIIDYLYNKVWHKNPKWVGGGDATHLRVYNPKLMKEILRKLNLQIDKWIGVGLVPDDILKWFFLLRIKIIIPYFQYLDLLFGKIFPFKYLGSGMLIRCKKIK